MYSFVLDGSFPALIQDEFLKGPSWCVRRNTARLNERWMATMENQFTRSACERDVMDLLPQAIINGNVYHDPYRVSVSLDTSKYIENPDSTSEVKVSPFVNETLPKTALTELSKKYKINLSGSGNWKYLDVLPKLGGKRYSIEMICRSRKIPLTQARKLGFPSFL